MRVNDWDDLGPVLKVKEAAKLLRVSGYKVRDLISNKEGQNFRVKRWTNF